MYVRADNWSKPYIAIPFWRVCYRRLVMQLMYPASVLMLSGLMDGNMLTCSRPWLSPWQLPALITLPLCNVVIIREVPTSLLRLTAIMVPECVPLLEMNGRVQLDSLVYRHSSDVECV